MTTHETVSIIVTIASGVLSIVFGILLLTFRYAISQRDRDVDRRIDDNTTLSKDNALELKSLAERVRQEEQKSIKLEGDLKLTNQAHTTADNDIDDIKKSMITRQEFDRGMTSIGETLRQNATLLSQILSQLQPARYAHQQDSRSEDKGGR